MSRIKTHTAIAMIKGDPCVLIGVSGERDPIDGFDTNPDEFTARHKSADPLIRFVNASSLKELMDSLDRCIDDHGYMLNAAQCVRDLEGIKPIDAKKEIREIAKILDPDFDRSFREDVRDTVEYWGYQAPAIAHSDVSGCEIGEWLPLRVVIDLRDDLRTYSNLLSSVYGKSKIDLWVEFKDLHREYSEDGFTYDLYPCIDPEDLKSPFSYETFRVYGYSKQKLKEEVARYVMQVFERMIKDNAPCFPHSRQPDWDGWGIQLPMPQSETGLLARSQTIQAAAWEHMANGICMTPQAHAISICPHCGRFFEMPRRTSVFCSKSCSEADHRKKAKATTAETGVDG